MLYPVTCPTCGLPLEMTLVFSKVSAKMLAEALEKNGTQKAKAGVDPDLKIEFDKLLTRLGVPRDRECCRVQYLTTVQLSEVY